MTGEFLNCYASGDGSLGFVWARTGHPRTCTNRKVTRGDVQGYLDGDGWRMRERGWRIWEDYGQFHLVAPVRRIDATTLELEGKRFEITNCEMADGRVVRHNFSVSVFAGGKVRDVRSISTLASLAHFVEHESRLPPLQAEEV
jgi:hypothetical protein